MSEFEPILFACKSYLPTEPAYYAEVEAYGDVFMSRADDDQGDEVYLIWGLLDTYTPDQDWECACDWDDPIAVLR